MMRIDLEAHTEVFGPLPRMSASELIAMAAEVDLRGQGGAAFPFARKLQAVVETAKETDQPTNDKVKPNATRPLIRPSEA